MKRTLFALTVAAAALAGCKTTAQVMSLPGTGMHASPLTRDEYVILGNAEGKACVEETCFVGLFCSTKGDKGSDTRVEGRLNTTFVQTNAPGLAIPGLSGAVGTEGNGSAAEDAALYAAIESVPDADALMSPRKSMEITTSNAIISTTQKACVHVFGKGIRLKTDAEIGALVPASAAGAAATAAPPPPPPPAPAPMTPAPTTTP